MGEDLRPDVERRGSMGSSRSRSGSGKGAVYPAPATAQDPSYYQYQHGYVRQHERRRISLLIPLIVAANVIMFVITMYINNCPSGINGSSCVARFLGRFSFQPLRENPLLGPSSTTLQKLGALDTNKVIHQHQGWRLITCMWLHAGVIHLLANMFSLLFIGIRLEQEFGFLKIGVIYILSGFGGSLLSALFLQNRISVGASGALFGLLGAMLSELITNWTIYANKCAALITLVMVVALNLAVGILPHVDNFAHIGGFITGFLAGFVFLIKPQFGWVNRANAPPTYDVQSRTRSKHRAYQYVLWVIAMLLLIAGFIAVIVLVFQGVDANKKCTWCHYLSCVPTSRWKCDDSSSSGTCNTVQFGNSLNVTCSGNNHSALAPANASTSTLQELCTQLCS